MPKIVLHICCGPCATAIVDWLEKQGFEVFSFFYNPNIEPEAEHNKRLKSLQEYFQTNEKPLIVPKITSPDYKSSFRKAIQDKEGKPERCQTCYQLRLEATAREAKLQKADFFTTTLLSSPHQNIKTIKNIGEKIACRQNLKFFAPHEPPKKFKGFRSLFTTCRKQAREANLYEQEYCGCLFSKEERFAKEQ